MDRPKITREMIVEAAKEIAGNVDIEAEDIAKRFRPHMDGYELAKELEHDGYNIRAADVEELDCMSNAVDDLHRAAEKKWVEENNIQPPLPIGTTIKQGVIHGVCPYTPARYQVKENGCTKDGRFLLIKFEDAVSA